MQRDYAFLYYIINMFTRTVFPLIRKINLNDTRIN